MGLGLFGGGVGVSQFLVSQGARVLVTDLRPASQLQESLVLLKDVPVGLRLGEHKKEDFVNTDVILVNPAVPDNSPFLELAHQHNIALDTEINIFMRESKAPIIGVTGSNGKSTTAAMIAHIFRTAGHQVWLGGNIGHSLLEDLPQIAPEHWVVMEISNFQLDRLPWVRISPHIAVITNLSPNHLDRHTNMEEYAAAKQNILKYQQPQDICVLNGHDPLVSTWGNLTVGRKIFFNRQGPQSVFLANGTIFWQNDQDKTAIIASRDIPLPGKAYEEDTMAASAVAISQNISPEVIAKAIRSFQGLPHRLEFCGIFNGRRLYNDSNATTPESTMAALEAIPGPIVLIAGGAGKKMSYVKMGKEIAAKAKIVILLGDTAAEIAEAIKKSTDTPPRIVEVDNLEEAVKCARALSLSGDAVILSPASTSFGMFRNFAERGDTFKKLIVKYFD